MDMNIREYMSKVLEELTSDLDNAMDEFKREVLRALYEEYTLSHPSETDEQREARRNAVRGMAVRLGVYEEFSRQFK
jgi:transcriptional regulator of aromatic amino acid metabolism